RSASASATAATASAAQAAQYAADAQAAADLVKASALAAGKSAAEAQAAATSAQGEIWKQRQATALESTYLADTVVVDDDGRVSAVFSRPEGDVKQEVVSEDMSKCVADDPGTLANWLFSDAKTWHKNAAGVEVCDVPVKVQPHGTMDYELKTCPTANVSIADCQGQYTNADVTPLTSVKLDAIKPFDDTIELTYDDYAAHYKVYCTPDGGCSTGDSGKILWQMLTGDIVKCWNHPGLNASCAWAAATVLPAGTLLKGAKVIVAAKIAIETGVAIDDAMTLVRTTSDVISAATAARVQGLVDSVARFRATLTDGVGTDAALADLARDGTVDRTLYQELQNEAEVATDVRTTCEDNSFPAGTTVRMADGTLRPIQNVRIGDRVQATDPATGATSAQSVVSTYEHDTTRLVDLDIDQVGRVTSTAGHRVYVAGTGWREVSALHVGDVLLGQDGTGHQVHALQDRAGAAPQKVYDLTVDGPHTFYVQGQQVSGADLLVHNCLSLVWDEANDPRAHTISDHVAQGPWGAGGATVGATDAEARAMAADKGINGVFSKLSVAQDALKAAISDKGIERRIARWLGGAGGDFLEFDIDVNIVDENGQAITSLGKVYKANGPNVANVAVSDAGTKVRIRLLKADLHNKKKWVVASIFPLARSGA
ncbi:polymorphic toxin-type HINT domain-containing protein, partial [Kitasatospora nipponensis]|uniref:polymorphic toxin-type HINT domain-containing protein n=1 Tax=Kitasatospora nipponensis TaxID=258049 RepID=UPI0031E2DBDC